MGYRPRRKMAKDSIGVTKPYIESTAMGISPFNDSYYTWSKSSNISSGLTQMSQRQLKEYEPTIAPIRPTNREDGDEDDEQEKKTEFLSETFVNNVDFEVNELEKLSDLLNRFVEWNEDVANFKKPKDRIIDIAEEVKKAVEHINIMRQNTPTYSLRWEEVSGVDDNLQVKFEKKHDYLQYQAYKGNNDARKEYALAKYNELIKKKKVRNVKLYKKYHVCVEIITKSQD